MEKASTALALLALLAVSVAATADDTLPASARRCSDLLSAAETSLGTPDGTDYVELFEAAFEVCDPQELPPDLLARYYEGRGDYLIVHEKSYLAAATNYEEGLDAVTAKVGLDDPLRIELLEGLASTLDSLLIHHLAERPERARQRVPNLLREALWVRQSAYGETSAEAAEGWCLLSFATQRHAPGLAEEYARTAVRVAEATGAYEPLRDALGCLRSALKAQGKSREVEELDERRLLLYIEAGRGSEEGVGAGS